MTFSIQRSTPLSEKEIYQFDCTGLIKLSGFLDKPSVEAVQSEIFSCPSEIMAGRGDKTRFTQLTKKNAALNALARDKRLVDCVQSLINQPLRLVESYGLLRGKESIFYVHNGNSEHVSYGDDRLVRKNMGYSHTYHDGKLYCMLVKVIFYFEDIKVEEDGPFCYMEGSHKANFPIFETTIHESEKPELTKDNFPTLQSVFAKSGDVIILNEALLHGTLPKTTGGQRLIMAFTYAPCFVSDWVPADIKSASIDKIGHY